MNFKLGLILLILFTFSDRLKAQDSLSISSIDIVQLDSGIIKPFYTDIPYLFQYTIKFVTTFENNSSDTLNDVEISYKLITKDSTNNTTIARFKNLNITDSIFPLSTNSANSDSLFRNMCVGNYFFRVIIRSKSKLFVDSAERFFSISDTTISKDFSDFVNETGPTHFTDTVNGIFGGDSRGDRFGTLFQYFDDTIRFSYSLYEPPTSLSFFVSNDTNNVGITIKAKIWKFIEDSVGTSNVVGTELLSSFHSVTLDSNDLGKWKTFPLDIGILTSKRTFELGEKYVAGWETTARNAKRNYLELMQDTSALLLQPENTSYVYFGHIPSAGWMSINTLPSIRVNYGKAFFRNICSYIVSLENQFEYSTHNLLLYPNPVANYFYLETESELATDFQLFNSLGQQFPINYLPTPEGYRFDAAHLPNGLYVLQINFTNGQVSSQKFIKAE